MHPFENDGRDPDQRTRFIIAEHCKHTTFASTMWFDRNDKT
jgi:hypothetical protein